ncbi:UNVERIFIED_CONTAM: hypothetical protein K2H54_036778 [Gekko kuhli]
MIDHLKGGNTVNLPKIDRVDAEEVKQQWVKLSEIGQRQFRAATHRPHAREREGTAGPALHDGARPDQRLQAAQAAGPVSMATDRAARQTPPTFHTSPASFSSSLTPFGDTRTSPPPDGRRSYYSARRQETGRR